MSDNLKEREAFEAWLNPGHHAQNVSPWVEPGRYEKESHQLAWLAWCAAIEADRVSRDVPATTGWVAKKDWYSVPVLFNPYTGAPRDVRDVQSDPQVFLIAVPGAQMLAAAPQPHPTGRHCKVGGPCVATAASDCACRELPLQPQPVQASPSDDAQKRNEDLWRLGRSVGK